MYPIVELTDEDPGYRDRKLDGGHLTTAENGISVHSVAIETEYEGN